MKKQTHVRKQKDNSTKVLDSNISNSHSTEKQKLLSKISLDDYSSWKLPWQTSLISLMKDKSDNSINMVSINVNRLDMLEFSSILGREGLITEIPPCNSYESVFINIDRTKRLGCYFIELDSYKDEKDFLDICRAIENIKVGRYKKYETNGFVYDYMEAPKVFVLVENLPTFCSLLNKSYWKFYIVNDKNDLSYINMHK